MKLKNVSLYPLCILAISTHTAQAQELPHWYAEKTIERKYATEIIGYGYDTSEEEAHANAVENVTTQIEAQIKTEFGCEELIKKQSQQKRNRRSASNPVEFYSQKCRKAIQILTDIKLTGLEGVKTDRQRDRRKRNVVYYYVAVKYDTADMIDKTARLIVAKDMPTGCSADSLTVPFEVNVQRRISEEYKITDACLLDWNLGVDEKSPHKSNPRWRLKVGEFFFAVKNYENLRDQFWPQQQSDYVELGFSQSQIYHEEPYSIKLQLNTENIDPVNSAAGKKNPAYQMSLFSVTERGQVTVLIDNHSIKAFANERIEFPDSAADLITEVPKNEDVVHELFLATLCTDTLPLSQFMQINETLVSDTEGYDYGRLLEVVKSEQCYISARQMMIQRKQR